MELVMFFIAAVVALIGAIAMLVSRNAVHSALFLLLNFGAIAILFLLLLAPFLFVVQLTVYAGAIMVLFLFVVMLLGAERAEDERDQIAWQRPLAITLGLVLLVQALIVAVRQVQTAPPQITGADMFGVPEKIGEILFTTYLFPFQLTGFILLIAIVGVVVLNQRSRAKR